ncbi:DoxX family protein [Pseudocolwellia sp. HL-MZ19]|uniref:DoxX family protein n=1 Tax=unclassified Pseudocolwellia TaxID=2848178 RepID=UPI003CED2935
MSDSEHSPHLFIKILYWLSTGIVLFLLTFAAISYHVMHDAQASYFTAFGYPTYLVYPLAYLKIAAILVIVCHKFNDLRDMAYAAYFLNMAMALVGHIVYGDFYGHALAGMIAIPISYLLGNKVRGRPSKNLFGRWTD